MTDGFNFTSLADFEVVNTFSVVQLSVESPITGSEWWVCGAFRPTSSISTKFAAVGGVSNGSVTAYIQVYEIDASTSPATGKFVGPVLTMTSQESERVISGSPRS